MNLFITYGGVRIDLDEVPDDHGVCFVCGVLPPDECPPKGWGCMHDSGLFYGTERHRRYREDKEKASCG